jgi:hypothetical protein
MNPEIPDEYLSIPIYVHPDLWKRELIHNRAIVVITRLRNTRGTRTIKEIAKKGRRRR